MALFQICGFADGGELARPRRRRWRRQPLPTRRCRGRSAALTRRSCSAWWRRASRRRCCRCSWPTPSGRASTAFLTSPDGCMAISPQGWTVVARSSSLALHPGKLDRLVAETSLRSLQPWALRVNSCHQLLQHAALVCLHTSSFIVLRRRLRSTSWRSGPRAARGLRYPTNFVSAAAAML